MKVRVDLNSDLGEHDGGPRFEVDRSIMPLITSANVSCGAHAGDPRSILRTLRLAAEHGVTVGAHVSYPDRSGFGRRRMRLPSETLFAEIVSQIGSLQALAHAAGTEVHYVKPHGALYSAIAEDEDQADSVIDAIRAVDPILPLVCLAGSALVARVAARGLISVQEAFADRAYGPNGALVPRSEAGAVLHDPVDVAGRMVRLVRKGVVAATDGSDIRVHAASICVHGDSPGAIQMTGSVRRALLAEGIELQAFVSER